ncbi:hypothetical protein [Haloechinothrix salitolerans]|uniref:Uncharacterized protein n=1 Tax=Haloechinothrix salitolerans TaxID=926830 RepID=A0ABW2BXK7_9PSEU
MSDDSFFSNDDVTRYLCAAARTDEKFSDKVVSALLGNDLHAVAPSVGFSLSPVLRHCLDAQSQRFRRDWLLLGLLLLAFVLSPLWLILALVLLLPLGGWLSATAQFGRIRDVVLALASIAVLLLVTAQLVSVLDTTESSAAPPSWPVGMPWLSVLAILAAYGVVVADEMKTRQILVRTLSRAGFDASDAPALPASRAWAADRLNDVERSSGGNTTIYHGFSPFVGYGPVVSHWSFALPTRRKEDRSSSNGSDLVPLDVLALINFVRRRLDTLGADPDQLSGLTVTDRVFLRGDALTRYPKVLPERDRMPTQELSESDVERIAADPSGPARHHLCVRVPSWGAEVVATTFLHFSTEGKLLHVRCDQAVLGPLRKPYHDVDRLTETFSADQMGQVLAGAATGLVGTLARAPVSIVRELLSRRWERERARARALAAQDLGYDYGARGCVRELAMDTEYHDYFQTTDAAKHLKLVERHALSAVLDFLDEHDVDTTEFRNRQMTILNQGVIQTGGISSIGNQAVGAGANATQSSVAATGTQPDAGRPN